MSVHVAGFIFSSILMLLMRYGFQQQLFENVRWHKTGWFLRINDCPFNNDRFFDVLQNQQDKSGVTLYYLQVTTFLIGDSSASPRCISTLLSPLSGFRRGGGVIETMQRGEATATGDTERLHALSVLLC